MATVPLASSLQSAAVALLSLPFDEGVMAALAAIGRDCAADRAWLYRYDQAVTRYWVTHEWCRDGVEACLPDIQGVPVDLIGWIQVKFASREVVAIDDVDRMPSKMQALKDELRREQVRATIGAPLFREDRLTGVVGLDDTRRARVWTRDEKQLLSMAGGLILAAERRPGLASNGCIVAAHPEMPRPGGVYLHATNTHVKAGFEDIVALEADGDYSRVHLRDGRVFHELRSLRSWLVILPPSDFLRVHRRYIVGLAHLRQLRRCAGGHWRLELTLPSLGPLPVGRSYQAGLKRALSLRGT